MAFDSVPWAIGGGALHSDEVARIFANAATRDAQGVLLPGNLKVTALGTPSGAVTIAAGAAVIRNQQAAGQSYIGRAGSSTQVSVSANNSGSIRRDLLIAEVVDPDFAPWQPSDVPDPASGPYFRPRIISGVAANTTTLAQAGLTSSGVPLARIDIPNGTVNITNAMIVDLRSLAQPRTGFAFDVQAVASQQILALAQTAYTDWPLNSLGVYVPPWATHAQVGINLQSPLGYGAGSGNGNGNADAYVRVNMNGLTSNPSVWDWNAPSNLAVTDAIGIPVTAYGEFDVQAMRGQTVVVKPQAARYATGVNTGKVVLDTWHQVEFDVRFSERTV